MMIFFILKLLVTHLVPIYVWPTCRPMGTVRRPLGPSWITMGDLISAKEVFRTVRSWFDIVLDHLNVGATDQRGV